MVVVGVMLVAIGVPAIIMVAWSTVSVWVGEAVVESSLDVREDIEPIVPGSRLPLLLLTVAMRL